MELNSLVWFNGGESYPLPGKIVEVAETGGVVVLSLITNKKINISDPKADLRVRHDNIEIETLDDLVVLKDLHEGSIVYNLWARYNKGLIYTYTGSILVAINPYQLLDIYGLDTVNKYHGQPLGTLYPHLFAIGSAAHERLVNQVEDQCIIISGESGAGKTESTKLIMQYLAVVSKGPKTNHVTEQILEANPLLESFGNAKTTKNDNSSRFGKYSEVFFSGGCIVGARITDYLLEKSRIVHQSQGERNYHVFYEMLAGMSPAEKAKYGLLTASGYNYLNQGGNHGNGTRNDPEEFQKLDRSLDVLSFKTTEKRTIFSILAAILHIGNIDFRLEGESLNTEEKLTIANHKQLEWASKLLHLSSSNLEKALIYKVTATATERILTERSLEQAVEARDGIAKSLYTCLFEWLVSRINSTIIRDTKLKSIAILDIYGFEVFTHNSFEQLCINHANEYLQFFFNRHIFQMEQMEYQKEKIQWTVVGYSNNQHTLDLMTTRPNGIFHLLDDESNFPQGSAKAFLEKCQYHHAGHASYSHPKTTPMCFTVIHYAGEVSYDVERFMEKNRDVLKPAMITLFQGSASEIISGMFYSLQKKETLRSSTDPAKAFAPKKVRAPTVATKFCESLDDLLSSMNRCNPFFVRCIKPNESKSPLTFDTDSVVEQLRYSGMLETVRIRKAGFPIRITFKRFAERYRFLAQSAPLKKSPKESALTILTKLDPQLKPEYKIGITKIFLKEYFENYLERKRNAVISKSVVVMQRYVRGYLARRQYRQLRQTILGLQAHIRGLMVRRRAKTVAVGVIFIQARIRGYLQRRRYARMLAQLRHQQKLQRLKEDELARQREAEAVVRARASAVVLMRELDQPPPDAPQVAPPVAPVTFDPIAISNLEIPHPLHVLLLDAEGTPLWYNEAKHVVKVPGAIPETKLAATLPPNIEDYPFSKYISIHFKTEDFGYSPTPLTTSLHKLGPDDEQEALAINKLILRFIHEVDQPSRALPEDKVFIVGSYIVQQCIAKPALRDEVYCQLCSLSWCNPSDACSKRVWVLLSNLLAVCPPTTTLKNYLLKYISDHAFDGYKSYCQHKVLSVDPYAREFGDSRSYPPTLLEWKAHQMLGRMTLATWFNDRQMLNHEVHSWVTGNDFAKALLQQRGVTTSNDGWSISMLEGGVRCELSGSDYVLDLIGEVEMPPKMETFDPSFLVSSENVSESKSRRNAPVTGAIGGITEAARAPVGLLTVEVPPAGPIAGPSNTDLYPANYPKPDYEIEKYQADRLRKRDAEGEPIYARVLKRKNRPESLLIQPQPQSDSEYVDQLFGNIGADDESLGLDDPEMMNYTLRGGGETPATQPAPAFYQPPAQPMYAPFQQPVQPSMFPQQPAYVPMQSPYMPMAQPMHPGMVPMMPQQAAPPGPDMQQALMAAQMQMQSMQTQQMVQNLQRQLASLQAAPPLPTPSNNPPQQRPTPTPLQAPAASNDQSATLRKLQREIDDLKRHQATSPKEASGREPSGRPKSALKWPDNWEGERPRSIKFDEDVEVIPHGHLERRKTPAVLPTYEGDKVQLSPTSGIPPPPPPPPPEPIRGAAEPMVLRTRKGNLISVSDDPDNRARTIRVGEVVWPPRSTEARKEEVIPGREIGTTTRNAQGPTPGKLQIQASELSVGSKNLKPTKTRETPKKAGKVTDRPPPIVAPKKRPPPAPPKRHTPAVKRVGVDEVDHHQAALKLLVANRAFQKPPPGPVNSTPPPAPTPPRPPVAPTTTPSPPILKQPTPPPVLPARDPATQRAAHGSEVSRVQAMLGKNTAAAKPVIAASTVTAVQVKRLRDCENVETRLFKRPQGDHYGYHRVPWTIQVRKEVFIPGETISSDKLVIELIFRQIVIDVSSNSCIRMTKAEKRMMRSLLAEGDISELNIAYKMDYAPRVIEKAQQLSLYFCRFFPVTSGRRDVRIDYVGVSHHSIVLVQRSTNPREDQLRAIETHEFSEVREVKATTHGNLRIVTMSNSTIPLYTRRAVQLQNMIDGYITFLRADSRYVKALRDYTPNESSLLGFQAGDVIKIREHEVVKENKDWMFGVLLGKTGFFPSQFVEPVTGQSEPPPPVAPVTARDKSDLDIPGRLSMEEFAMKHFRELPDRLSLRRKKGLLGSMTNSLRKGTGKSINASLLMEYNGLVTFVGSPIIVSLLPLEPEDNQRAKDCFVALMQIMGDHPVMKRNADDTADKAMYRALITILKTVRQHQSLVDEIYCHAVKQTTNNKSQDSQSCLRGWRVFYILAMYARCSDALKPYLFHHLEGCSTVEAENRYSAMANSCQLNLRKTFRQGTRSNPPTREEVSNLIRNGRMHKQHPFLIPPDNQKSIRVKGNTLVSEAIELLGAEMNVVQDKEIREFDVLLITVKQSRREHELLERGTYLLDAVSKSSQTFILVRTHWRYKLKIENQLLLSLLFTQIKQDYLQNKIILLSDQGLTSTLKEMISFLGAILLRAQNLSQVPTMKDLPNLLPSMLLSDDVSQPSISPNQWLNMIQQRVTADTSRLTPNKAMMQFLHLTENAKLYGSAFFEIKSSTNQVLSSERCLMAVNKNGIHFLDMKRYVLLFSYHPDEVISATPFTTPEGENVLKINSGSLQDLQAEHYELEKTEQASLLIEDYLQHNRGRPVISIDEDAMLSMENRRAAVEEAISRPLARNPSFQRRPAPPVGNGLPAPLYERSIDVTAGAPHPEGKPSAAPTPLESLPEETNGHVPNGTAPQDPSPRYGRGAPQATKGPAPQPPPSGNILGRGMGRKAKYNL